VTTGGLGPHGGRPDHRLRRAARRARAAAARGVAAPHRGALPRARPGRDAGQQPQAGADPRGQRAGTQPDGHRAGLRLPGPERRRNPTRRVSLPGVPREMRRMVEETLVPWVRERQPDRLASPPASSASSGSPSRSWTSCWWGWLEPGEARLAFRAAFPRSRPARRWRARRATTWRAGSTRSRRGCASARRPPLRGRRRGDGGGDRPAAAASGALTLAVAESCTGGLIGHRITEVPGSSAYFLLGIVSYSNEAKERLLGVPAATLREHGAVSAETAEAMAAGVRRQSRRRPRAGDHRDRGPRGAARRRSRSAPSDASRWRWEAILPGTPVPLVTAAYLRRRVPAREVDAWAERLAPSATGSSRDDRADRGPPAPV
jgi:hypothetical protein